MTTFVVSVNAQGFDQDRIALAKFIERMYNNSPFEGCRFVDDYEDTYFLSVIALEKTKYKDELIMNRVAETKSQRNAGEFFNGTQSYTEFTIRTPKSEEKGGSEGIAETYEIIRTNTTGYVEMMQLFTSFEHGANKVFVFAKKINDKKNK